MKIESIIQRKGGTKITLERTQYHFKPTEQDPRHIADVERESHISTLLRITEGFRLVDGEQLDANMEQAIADSMKLKGSVVHNAAYTIKGREITLEELVLMSWEDSRLSRDDWNALEDEQRYEFIDRLLAELEQDEATAAVEPREVRDEFIPEKDPDPDEEEQEQADELKSAPTIEQAPAEQPKPAEPPKPEPAKAEAPTAEATNDPFAGLDRDALSELYVKKMGRKPHNKLSISRIIEVLKDA